MSEFWIINLLLLGILTFLLLVLSMVWPPDSPWAPWWRTSRKTARAMCGLAGVGTKEMIFDLGCGDAAALITAAKEFGARGVGIEIDPMRFFIATLMIYIIKVNRKVTIKRKNFFREDISPATVVFVYLVPRALDRLIPKFKKELKKGTRIVSYRYPMRLPLKKKDEIHNIFVYEV